MPLVGEVRTTSPKLIAWAEANPETLGIEDLPIALRASIRDLAIRSGFDQSARITELAVREKDGTKYLAAAMVIDG